MKKITIVGAGFAALSAARKLRQLDTDVEITLIAPKAELGALKNQVQHFWEKMLHGKNIQAVEC
ncbi:MAG: hypothetical protein FD173_582 [Gallionellaceae bacterium]|nr:MAG: hypothetical protein FD173_582 [Gallionellaceae bacterium]